MTTGISKRMVLGAVALVGMVGACDMPTRVPRVYPIATVRVPYFVHATYDYSIAADATGTGVLAPEWRLDNFVPTANGPGAPKDTDDYTTTVALDHDGDGHEDASERIPSFDLLYKHLRHNGTIFVSTVPQSQHARERNLDVILRDFVESAAHTGRIEHDFQSGRSFGGPEQASRVLVSRAATVSGYPAHEALFELANVQEMELSPSARWMRGHVVVVRAEFAYTPSQTTQMPTGNQDRVQAFYPVLLVFGYANHPDDFDASHGDFVDMIRRTGIGQRYDWTDLQSRVQGCGYTGISLDMLMGRDGRISAASIRRDDPTFECVWNVFRGIGLPRSEWPTTLSMPMTGARRAGGATTVSASIIDVATGR